MGEEKKKDEDTGWLIAMMGIVILAVGMAGTFHAGILGTYKIADSKEQVVSERFGYPMEEAQEYTLYIGLNDKDEYRQLISAQEAKEIIDAICMQYVDGYTVTEAKGAWVDEKNMLTQENTLVYHFREADEEALKEIMDRVIVVLNQNTILVEEQTVSYAYYGGKAEEKAEAADVKDRK